MQLQQVATGTNRTFDLYDQGVSEGNPQPPFGESSEKINLNELLITNEVATLFCRVSGSSMKPHMRDSVVLMVDKSIKPKAENVALAAINSEITVKRLSEVDGQMAFAADKPDCPSVMVDNFDV